MAGETSSGSGAADRSTNSETGRTDDPWRRIEPERPQREAARKAWDETHDPSPEFEYAIRPLGDDYGRDRPKHRELTEEQRAELAEVFGRPGDELLALRDRDPRAGHNRDDQGRILGPDGSPRPERTPEEILREAQRQADLYGPNAKHEAADSSDSSEPSDDSDAPSAQELPPQGSSETHDEGKDQDVPSRTVDLSPDTAAQLGQLAADLRAGRLTPEEAADRLEQLPRQRADFPHAVTRPDLAPDYNPSVPPTTEERYFVRDKNNPIPIFDGDPKREHVAQGQIGDCGVLATLGAIAGHQPDAIRSAVKQTGPDQYAVTLHEVRPAIITNPVARPTGNTVTLHMNDTIPVDTSDPNRPPAGAEARSCGWPALLEKAVASEDQAWDQQQRTAWNGEWQHALKPDVDQSRYQAGLPASPMAAPTGYNRLDMGTTSEDRATLLAQITGKEAEVRPIPGEQHGEQALLNEFQTQLANGKAILVGSREKIPGESHPFSRTVFEFGHAFEVTKVENGKIHLHNPWGDWATPPPMDAKTFWEYFQRYGRTGTRAGDYSTLK